MSNSDSLSSYSTFSSSSLKSGAKALQFSFRSGEGNGDQVMGIFPKNLQPLQEVKTVAYHLVLSPDGHNATGNGGNDRSHRVPLDRSKVI